MRFHNLLGAATLGALLMSMTAATQAASFSTTEYTVTYDDSTSFGSIAGNGGGSDGISQHLSFSWNAPFGGSTGHDPLVAAAGAVKTFLLPSFTLTAHSGYEFSNLTVTLGGSVFGAASASATVGNGLGITYTGPGGSFGTWTLSAAKTTGGYSTLTFSGGTLTLNGTAGAIFATKGPEVLFNVAAVPEPGSFALALAGLGVAAAALRRRRA